MKYVPDEILIVGVAMMGGVSRALNEFLNETGHFTGGRLLANLVIGGFAGYVFAQFGTLMFDPHSKMIVVLAGIGGWGGGKTLDRLGKHLERKYSKHDCI